MALIAMCVYCTDENDRFKYAKESLKSLYETENPFTNRFVIIDNGSNEETKQFLKEFKAEGCPAITVITLNKNIGTARGINIAIKMRKSGEHVIKCDDDCKWNDSNWVYEMEEVIERDSSIGIVGLKRKDLAEWPLSEHPFYKSEFIALPHEPGQRWIIAESVRHVMGTCQMISSNLLDKVGYFFQNGLYGLDDSDMSYRSELSGFKNVFLPHIDIDHLDNGGTDYTLWKHQHASERMGAYGEMCEAYRNGTRSLYYNGGFND